MYWPRVLIIPVGPAPYLNMLTVPGEESDLSASAQRQFGGSAYRR